MWFPLNFGVFRGFGGNRRIFDQNFFCKFLITGTGIDSVVISFTGELDNVKNLPSDVVNTCLDTFAGISARNSNRT